MAREQVRKEAGDTAAASVSRKDAKQKELPAPQAPPALPSFRDVPARVAWEPGDPERTWPPHSVINGRVVQIPKPFVAAVRSPELANGTETADAPGAFASALKSAAKKAAKAAVYVAKLSVVCTAISFVGIPFFLAAFIPLAFVIGADAAFFAVGAVYYPAVLYAGAKVLKRYEKPRAHG